MLLLLVGSMTPILSFGSLCSALPSPTSSAHTSQRAPPPSPELRTPLRCGRLCGPPPRPRDTSPQCSWPVYRTWMVRWWPTTQPSSRYLRQSCCGPLGRCPVCSVWARGECCSTAWPGRGPGWARPSVRPGLAWPTQRLHTTCCDTDFPARSTGGSVPLFSQR